MAITFFPKFAGIGRTSSLLDEELILLGNDWLGTKGGSYISIQKPRDGLLAMKYRIEKIPLAGLPHQHTSLVSKNTLTVVGGKFKSKGMLSKFTWTGLSLHWQNGTKFKTDFVASCAVKIGVDVHIIFGGELKINDQRTSGRQVVKINTTQQVAFEMKPMQRRRMSHACQLLNSSFVLLSGGLDKSVIQPDEIYNIASQEDFRVLDLQQSLRRIQHAMIKIDDRVLALGGSDSNNDAPSKVAEFDQTTNSWNELDQELLSTNTSELIVTQFPVSSLDCVPECHCGIANRKERIFGGTEAEVGNTCGLCQSKAPFQPNAYPWIAALLRDGDIVDGYINSKCGATLVNTLLINYISCFQYVKKNFQTLSYLFSSLRLETDLP